MHKEIRRWATLTVIANVVFVLAWLLAATWQGPAYRCGLVDPHQGH